VPGAANPMKPAAFNLGDAGTLGFEVFPILNQLRESEPIHWNKAAHCWVVSRHQDIMTALSGSLPLSNLRLTAASLSVIPFDQWPQRLPNMSHYSRFHITNMDPPNHTRLRKLMTKAFGKQVVEGMRPFVRERVRQLLEQMRGQGVVEFNGEIARELPGRVILELLHFPESIFPRLMSWAHEVMVGLGTPNPRAEWVEAADRAFAEMTGHFLIQIADRRRQSRGPEDFISALVTARDGHDGTGPAPRDLGAHAPKPGPVPGKRAGNHALYRHVRRAESRSWRGLRMARQAAEERRCRISHVSRRQSRSTRVSQPGAIRSHAQ
jgi:cytochrome P450